MDGAGGLCECALCCVCCICVFELGSQPVDSSTFLLGEYIRENRISCAYFCSGDFDFCSLLTHYVFDSSLL